MKTLYISHFDSTGYGRASIETVLAMDAANIDVVPRPFILNNSKPEFKGRLLELAQKDASGCHTVIFHTLPHFLERGNFKRHICHFASESSNFQDSNWPLYLNQMDECWVINNESKQACIDSGVKVPIKVVPHACDPERYNKTFNKLNIPVPPDQIIFYTVGEFTRRKNLVSLVKAFHLEFDRTLDNVQLLLKVNKSGISGPELSKVVGEFCNDIKKGLKLYTNITDYKPELILTDHLTDEQLLQLHYTCDVYCNTSLGEAWNLPLFDAAAMGNYVISTDEGGPHDYLSNHPYSSLVKSSKESAFGFNDTHANLYTGRELVSNINIGDLRLAMRKAYELKKEKNIVAGRGLAAKYSYNIVGNLIKSYLEM